jgi:hypothetical protein
MQTEETFGMLEISWSDKAQKEERVIYREFYPRNVYCSLVPQYDKSVVLLG